MGGFWYSVRENFWSLCVFVSVVVVLVTVAVIIAAYGVLRHISITVTEASLTRFSLATPETVMAYHLSLTLEVHNPNWAITMTNTEKLKAAYSFSGQQFEPAVQVSDEGTRYAAAKTSVLRVDSGSDGNYVALGNAGVFDYKKQKADGTFEVEVKLTGKVKYTGRYTKCNIEATCPLKLQLVEPSAGTPAPGVVVFQKVPCEFAKAEKNC